MIIVKIPLSDDLAAPSSSPYFKSSFRRSVPLFVLQWYKSLRPYARPQPVVSVFHVPKK